MTGDDGGSLANADPAPLLAVALAAEVSWQFVDHDKHTAPTNYTLLDAQKCNSTTTQTAFFTLIDTHKVRSIVNA